MERSTMPLFEREIRAQVNAARLAVAEAERGEDLTLADAARAHLQSLVELAGRNGLTVDPDAAAVVAQPTGPAGTGTDDAGPELANA